MKLKIAGGKEIEITEEVAKALSGIIAGLHFSISDNYVIWNLEIFSEIYEKLRDLYLFGIA